MTELWGCGVGTQELRCTDDPERAPSRVSLWAPPGPHRGSVLSSAALSGEVASLSSPAHRWTRVIQGMAMLLERQGLESKGIFI